MTEESSSDDRVADRVSAYRRTYRRAQVRGKMEGRLATALVVGELASLLGLVVGIGALVRGRVGLGTGLLVVSVALSALLYMAHFVAVSLLDSRQPTDSA